MNGLRAGIPGLALCLWFMFVAESVQAEIGHATDDLYQRISRSVAEADFDLMARTYHADAILVSEKTTRPVADVIPLWRKSGEAAKKRGVQATVTFRFKSRQINETTGFESGIFRYQSTDSEGNSSAQYVHFESLTIRQEGTWLTLMERQKGPADKVQWDKLEAH